MRGTSCTRERSSRRCPKSSDFCVPRWGAISGCVAWSAGDSVVRDSLYGDGFGFGWPHQVPGFAILLKGRALASGRNAYYFAIFDQRYREDIPCIFREDVSHQEVDFFSGIWNIAGYPAEFGFGFTTWR